MFEVKRIIKDIWANYGIDISYLIAVGMLHIDDAKNWLVRNEYERLYKSGDFKTYTEVKEYLIKRYDISLSSIEKMIYRDHKI
jgi:hypothetical protein